MLSYRIPSIPQIYSESNLQLQWITHSNLNGQSVVSFSEYPRMSTWVYFLLHYSVVSWSGKAQELSDNVPSSKIGLNVSWEYPENILGIS